MAEAADDGSSLLSKGYRHEAKLLSKSHDVIHSLAENRRLLVPTGHVIRRF